MAGWQLTLTKWLVKSTTAQDFATILKAVVTMFKSHGEIRSNGLKQRKMVK